MKSVGAKYLKLNVFLGLFLSLCAISARAEVDMQEDAGSDLYQELIDRKDFFSEQNKLPREKKSYKFEVDQGAFQSYEGRGPKEAPPKAVRLYPHVVIDILKVKATSRTNITDSILGVTDAKGQLKEIVLVTLDGELTHAFATSTAQSYKKRYHKKKGWIYPSTPEGEDFHPHTLSRNHSSSVYGDGKSVNMPFAIFFNGGVAVHGTTPDHFGEIGIKDSGACSRLYPSDAAKIWNYVNPSGLHYISSEDNASVLAEIRNRVTINVYGFDGTSSAKRQQIYAKYEASIPWIQAEVRKNLARIAARK